MVGEYTYWKLANTMKKGFVVFADVGKLVYHTRLDKCEPGET